MIIKPQTLNTARREIIVITIRYDRNPEHIISGRALTSTSLRRQREYERGGALPSCHRATERLRFETAQLLHEIRALHQRYVGKVQITQYVILEPPGPFLVRAGQVHTARIAPQTFFVIVFVVVQQRSFCKQYYYDFTIISYWSRRRGGFVSKLGKLLLFLFFYTELMTNVFYTVNYAFDKRRDVRG